MKPRTRSAFAPTYAVETRTTAMSLRGYCRTLRARIDCRPAMRITRLTTIARTGRLTNKSVNRILTILRFRSRLVLRLNLVVDNNGRAVAKFEDSGGDDFFSRFDSFNDGDLIAARGAELHELLPYGEVLFSFRILQVLDDEHGISVGRIADRR